ncbi:DUF268 domain-containing protein [uncultured Aquabacterium sp.]|jgi:SAM-dependent methyltransferase|uniref:DUF268 domain-containing protein n=1 Tax=uncultured Aquabacterium sp. TaxID=158753 RepID=UPI0026273F18|nr:DUF268 domain-containing protein [uncultured Aquabacterium sp.]
MSTSSFARRLGTALISMGFDPRKSWAALRAVPRYVTDGWRIREQLRNSGNRLAVRFVPTLSDVYASSGTAKGHYFHQDLWAARRIFQRNPKRHVDVGSRIDGFIAHLLCFRAVEVLDIRHLDSRVAGLTFRQVDMMNPPGEMMACADSVSCLHALEHFGLGRYGDPVDVDGWLKGLAALSSLLKPGGALYLSVPVGLPCIEFNAQRIFAPQEIIDAALVHGLRLQEFSYVDDHGMFHENSRFLDAAALDFGCGCYVFCKS